MFDYYFNILSIIDDYLWSYLGITLVILLGLYFSVKFNFGQIFGFGAIIKSFYKFIDGKNSNKQGVSPLRVFFSSIGGCIGIGNIVAVCTAVQIGGPGAIFWMWIAAFLGALLKYSEVYLGIKYRVKNDRGGYDGGPMYFLQHAFTSKAIPILVAIFLCIYGTEVYMFNTITETININWGVNIWLLIPVLLGAIFYAGSGGIDRVGKICEIIIPGFLIIFSAMSLYVIVSNATSIVDIFVTIFKSAFSGHAAVGGFAGSTIQLTAAQGIARGCYTSDMGIGFASIIHAETSLKNPQRQAGLAIFGIFIDTFIVCTCSTVIIIATGVWSQDLPASILVQTALAQYFPHMTIFMPIFLFILGYSSMISFFCVGLKSARFVSKKYGETYYYIISAILFIFFSFVESKYALTIMSISGICLLTINSIGIFLLRSKVNFSISQLNQ